MKTSVTTIDLFTDVDNNHESPYSEQEFLDAQHDVMVAAEQSEFLGGHTVYDKFQEASRLALNGTQNSGFTLRFQDRNPSFSAGFLENLAERGYRVTSTDVRKAVDEELQLQVWFRPDN